MVLEQVVDYYLKFGKSTYDRKLKNYSLNFKLCNNSWTLLKEGFSYNCFYYIPERKIFGEIKKKTRNEIFTLSFSHFHIFPDIL